MKKEKLIPVEDKPDLFRDPVSGALINMDTNGANRARVARQRVQEQQQLVEQQQKDIKKIEEELSELKDLLKQLLERT